MLHTFFNETEVSTKVNRSKVAGRRGCSACKLYTDCISPRMEATGEGKEGIFILAEAPGAEEDKRGIQLIGKSGSLVRSTLREMGIDLDRDCRKMNAVNCRPPHNKTPTDIQIACCRARVMQEIRAFKPKVILAFGGPAMKSLCQHRCLWEKGFPGITQWQGACIPDQDLGCWIVPTYHPAYVMRMEDNPVYEMKWQKDLETAVIKAGEAPPVIHDYRSMVDFTVSTSSAIHKLEQLYDYLLREKAGVAFDYETTGLKPYLEGHHIACVSFGWKENGQAKALAVPTTNETWPAIARILRDGRIGKRAHNMKFEELWSRVRGYPEINGFRVQGWEWDSMIAAHVLDNRPVYTQLKLQAYLNFGVLGYDDAIASYIRKKGSPNLINNVDDAPLRTLLLYCGYDSLFEFLLSEKQRKVLLSDEGLRKGYQLLHDGALALVSAEENGIIVDLDYCQSQLNHLSRKLDYYKARILRYKEVKKWREMAGNSFNLASPVQLRNLLVRHLGVEIAKKTAAGMEAVDKETLEDIDLPFVKDLLYIRKLEKIKSTYLSGYMTEAPDGVLHPFYHLHSVVSYRGSCSDPNFGHCLEVVKPCEFREQPERPILSQALTV